MNTPHLDHVQTDYTINVLIIGAGPAGLAFANYLGLAERQMMPNTMGCCFAHIQPIHEKFGESRCNTFGQPYVDAVMHRGRECFANARLLMSPDAAAFQQDEQGFILRMNGPESRQARLRPKRTRASPKMQIGATGGKVGLR